MKNRKLPSYIYFTSPYPKYNTYQMDSINDYFKQILYAYDNQKDYIVRELLKRLNKKQKLEFLYYLKEKNITLNRIRI